MLTNARVTYPLIQAHLGLVYSKVRFPVKLKFPLPVVGDLSQFLLLKFKSPTIIALSTVCPWV